MQALSKTHERDAGALRQSLIRIAAAGSTADMGRCAWPKP
jgi:hypothetical protein